MIIVLEGPDCAGKSTLAAALTVSGGSIIGNGPPPRDGSLLKHYSDQIAGAMSSRLTVFDRLHIGELVYGPVFRGKSRLSTADVSALESQLDGLGALKLYVDCADEVLLSRMQGRGDAMVKSPAQLLELAHAYRELFSKENTLSSWRTVRTDEGPIDTVGLIG